jgi:lysophospholipase L1-like esterase
LARLTGPDEAYRLVYLKNSGVARAQGLTGHLYADLAGTTPADLLYPDNSAVPTSGGAAVVTIDDDSKWPRVQYPDGVDTIYGSVNGGRIVPLLSDVDGRIDANTAAIAALAVATTPATLAANSAFTANYVRTTSIGGRALRLGDFYPVMAVPYTTAYANVTGGTVTSASSISGAVRIPAETPGAFRYGGGALISGGSLSGPVQWVTYGGSTGPQQSQSPFVVEFTLDTVGGSFDIVIKQFASAQLRVAIDGQYLSRVATFTPNQSGAQPALCNISGLSAGRHTIRIECSKAVGFAGVNVQATDGVLATLGRRTRVVVIGDSYTEPTVADSTTNAFTGFGWVQAFGLVLGVDAWSSGSGGTGYLVPGGSSRVKFRDRLTNDVIAYNPDLVIWAGGHNDVGTYTSAQIGAEAALCFSTLATALPNCQQVVAGPMWGYGPNIPTGTAYDARDAIRSAALAAGLIWIDPQESPLDLTAQGASTLQASTSAAATTFSSGVNYRIGTWLKIGTTTAQEVRQTTNASGSGPYTITVAALTNAHTSGDPITETGPGWITGNGRQGTTNGSGTADRYTGSDSTHPTQAGHEALGLHVARALYVALSAH